MTWGTAQAGMSSVAESQTSDRLDSPRSHSRPPWPPATVSASAYVHAHPSSLFPPDPPQGITIHRPIIYGNTAVVLTQKERETLPTPDHTHRWTVAVRSAASADPETVGGKDDLSYFVKRVTFKLHDTYTVPTRSESVATAFLSTPA